MQINFSCRYESKGMQWLNSMPTLPPGLNPTEPATTKAVKVSKKQKKKSQTDSLKQPREADDLVEFVARKLDDLTCKDSRKNSNQEPAEQEFKVVTSRKSKAKSKATAENVTTTNNNTNINTTPTTIFATSSSSNNNNCKVNSTQKTIKLKAKAASSSNTTTPATTTANNNKKNTNNNNNSGGGGVEAGEGGQTDPGKRLRNLKKKLKQIEELEAKIKGGQLNPSQEQRDKVTRKKAVKAEIKKLEAIVC